MLEDKFDEISLKELDKKLKEIQLWATMQRSDEHMLYHMIDNLCRVAVMYNDVLMQLLRDGHIVTSDPLNYIEAKFSTPYSIYKKRMNIDNEQYK
ncbi:hypothetical protein [Paenibacillus sp. Soil750]|uniref:hypothetical protein n=1 Tax=Paenibacillus sp. Soil750 TaxID=1736398 RepID=UPI0006F6D664|nr:hypothetical protein [Paenibacillus sp. Soil750]KRE71984.1 hypothetical protein ASL11_09410 [Paenibacillus sp. Soil750]